jgi:hypothetical protein
MFEVTGQSGYDTVKYRVHILAEAHHKMAEMREDPHWQLGSIQLAIVIEE